MVKSATIGKSRQKAGGSVETDFFIMSKSSGNLVFQFLDNELNLFNIDEISRSYHSVLRSYTDTYDAVVLDLENVRLIDSSTVAFLVRAHLIARKGKKEFFIKNISEGISKTLEYANLLKDFNILQ